MRKAYLRNIFLAALSLSILFNTGWMFATASDNDSKNSSEVGGMPNAELQSIMDERKKLDEAIESGEVKPVNPNVVVRNSNGKVIWSGKANEWAQAQDRVFKEHKLGKYQVN